MSDFLKHKEQIAQKIFNNPHYTAYYCRRYLGVNKWFVNAVRQRRLFPHLEPEYLCHEPCFDQLPRTDHTRWIEQQLALAEMNEARDNAQRQRKRKRIRVAPDDTL